MNYIKTTRKNSHTIKSRTLSYSNTVNYAPQRRAYIAWQLERLRGEDLDMPYVHEPVSGRNALSLSEAARLDALDYVALHPGQNVREVQKTFEHFRAEM